MKKSRQLEFLDNDVAVLETMFANQDGHWLTLPGDYMPDGKEFKVSLEGVTKMTSELRQSLVQTVRSQYDARETEQNAPKVRETDAPASDNGGADTSPGDGGTSSPPASAAVPEPQIGLEETLREREDFLRAGLEQAEFELGNAREVRNNIQRELREVEVCIQALQNVSPKTSSRSESPTESQPQPSGSAKGSPKGSRRKTTAKSNKN